MVTSPYHLRRAVRWFRKAGFRNVTGLLADDTVAEAEVGPWGWLRYGLWGHGAASFLMTRELVAIAFCQMAQTP